LKTFLLPLFLAAIVMNAPGAELRLGIIGCDTSHSTAFTEILNDAKAKDHVPGAMVVAAYKGGSQDIESSRSRVEGYSATLQQKYGIRFYENIEDLCQHVDAVLLDSLDGRTHLEQSRPVLKARKKLFIDKPMAASLQDVREIFRLAKQENVPVFSSSALRFSKETQAALKGTRGRVISVETYGPCELEPHHPDLFWYGVHGVEGLYTILGRGCETVQRGLTADGKIEVTGLWSGHRKGVFRESKDFHGIIKTEQREAPVGSFDGYARLIAEMVQFFQTGIAPVSPEETLEIFAFMEAADESKRQAGAKVKISDILKAPGR